MDNDEAVCFVLGLIIGAFLSTLVHLLIAESKLNECAEKHNVYECEWPEPVSVIGETHFR